MGDYKINGISIADPTSGTWVPNRPLDYSGEGRPVYPPLRDFKIQWNLMAIADLDVIRDEWQKDQATGTVTVDLPDIKQNSYLFRTFSGCHLEEPQASQYFEQYATEVILVVTAIRI
jgi:hypothetical protein